MSKTGNTGGVGGNIDGGRELSIVEQKDPMLGALLRRVMNGVNTLSTNSGVSATGEVAAPKPPDSVNVSTSNEMMHISISHGGQLNRNVRYFSEIDTDPSFPRPLVVDHGTSRTSHPIPMPSGTANPSFNPANPVGPSNQPCIPTKYFVRSYAQYPGAQPSAPTPFGGKAATAVQMQGLATTSGVISQFTPTNLLPSTGSGTASNSGQQGGQGLGKVQKRS